MSRIVRKVTKRSYDQYSFSDYNILSDNLNPINPTQLESQYSEILQSVKKRIVEAYEKANIKVPEELFQPDVSPSALLNDVDALINKIKNNPLENLYDTLGSFDVMASFATAPEKANSIIDNPLKLDCNGIEESLKGSTMNSLLQSANVFGAEKDSTSSNDSSSETGTDDALDESYNENEDISSKIIITYVGLQASENMSKFPTTVLESECPVQIPLPDETPDAKIFGGWYYDSFYNQRLINNSLDFPGKDITLYAYFKNIEDTDDNDRDSDFVDTNLDLGRDPGECDLIDLAFLKIILIIITVAKVLIQVLVMVVTLMKTVAEVVKEAQLCWINPPLLTSMIGYVMQRLGALIFQILGMILLKLWAMLNMDCISANAMNTIAQINAVLAGIMDIVGSVDSLAIDFGNFSGKGLWDSIKEMIKSLKEQVKEQGNKVWEDMKNIGSSLKATGKDIADTYSNPATYLAAVPPEIRNQITEQLEAINNTKETIKNIQATVNKITNKKKANTNDLPKGVEVMIF